MNMRNTLKTLTTTYGGAGHENTVADTIRNMADQMVYQTEKTLTDLGDKISADDKASIQAAADKLKELNKGTDLAAIKAAIDEVQQAFYKVSEKLYQQQAPQGNPQGGYTQPGNDGVVDADYETVD